MSKKKRTKLSQTSSANSKIGDSTNWQAKALTKLLITLLIINVVYVSLGAVLTPLSHIDVIADWMYKAQVLAESPSLKFLQLWQGEFAHPQYPILLPFLFSLILKTTGESGVIIVSLLSSLVYALILFLCYSVLRQQKYSHNWSLLFTYICSMMPPLLAQAGREHAGMADIYLTLLYWLAIWIIFKNVARLSWWLIPVVIVGSLIKTEGIFLLLFFWFTPQSWRLKSFQMLLASAGFLSWQILLKVLNIPATYSLTIPSFSSLFSRFGVMSVEMIKELFLNIHNWYIFWWVFALLLLAKNQKKTDSQHWIEKCLILLLLGFTTIYLMTDVPINGYVSSSFDRLLLQILPLWYLIFVRNAYSVFSQFKSKSFSKWIDVFFKF